MGTDASTVSSVDMVVGTANGATEGPAMARRDLAVLIAAAAGLAVGCTQEAASSDELEAFGVVSQAASLGVLTWVETVVGLVNGGVRTGTLAIENSGSLSNAIVVIAKGCVAAGDGGGGVFYWDAATTGDDWGTIIVPSKGGGRWVRIFTGALNVRWFGGRLTGSPDLTPALAKAVAAAGPTGELYWPKGTYYTTGSIAGLHTVRHRGPGIVQRGPNLFAPEPKATSVNILYVAPTNLWGTPSIPGCQASACGGPSNDGLSDQQPMILADAIAALHNYGPCLEGQWTVSLAKGHYPGGQTLLNLRSKEWIRFCGPDVVHPTEPTAVIDAALGGGVNGVYIQFGVNSTWEDVKFKGFSGAGLAVEEHCDLTTKNVHAEGCGVGIDLENLSRARIEGGIIDGCGEGVRGYSQCSLSIGYNGKEPNNRMIIRNCKSHGITVRDSSRGHVDNVDFSNNAVSLYLEKVSRGVANDCKFEVAAGQVAVRSELLCAYGESEPNVFSGAGQRYVLYSSVDSNASYNNYYDPVLKRWLYGADAYATPALKYVWVSGNTQAVGSYNSNARFAFEGDRPVNYLALSGPQNSANGILVATATDSGAAWSAAWLLYESAANRWRIAANGNERYQIDQAGFFPLNMPQTLQPTLGTSGLAWSESWVDKRYFAPGVYDGVGLGAPTDQGAGIGSTYRCTSPDANGGLWVKEGTGWVKK